MDHRALSDLSALTHGERLLLRTTRALALDIDCRGFRSQFEDACGWAGPEAFRALGVFIAQVGLKGRRRLTISLPGDERVTADETLLLTTFASAQAEDYRGLEAGLRRLLSCEAQRPLGAAACMVGQALALNGLSLPWRHAAALWAADDRESPESGADWAAAPIRSAASPPSA